MKTDTGQSIYCRLSASRMQKGPGRTTEKTGNGEVLFCCKISPTFAMTHWWVEFFK